MFERLSPVEVVATLAETDCEVLATPSLVRVMADAAAVVAWAESMVLAAVAELRSRRQQEHRQLCDELGPAGRDGRAADPDEVDRFCAVEVATVLQLSHRAATDRVALAEGLTTRLIATMRELGAGNIGLPQARTVHDAVSFLDLASARAVESDVLPGAGEVTTGQLAARARRAVTRLGPRAAAARCAEARAARRADTWGLDDGVAALEVTGPAETVAAAWARVDALARQSQDAARSALRCLESQEGVAAETDAVCGVPTLDQLRADTVLRLLAGTHDLTEQPSPFVTVGVDVLVPVGTLMGFSDAPAELAGHGPLPADVARALAARSGWRRVLTAPDGTVAAGCSGPGPCVHAPDSHGLESHAHGSTIYRPSRALARAVRARDVTCRFPGCRRAALRCDVDHTVPHPDGPTAGCNLACLCRMHHRAKHRAGWRLEQLSAGRLRWTSPSGLVLVTDAPVVSAPPGRPVGVLHGATGSPVSPPTDDVDEPEAEDPPWAARGG